MRLCPNCGQEVPDEDRDCPYCGENLRPIYTEPQHTWPRPPVANPVPTQPVHTRPPVYAPPAQAQPAASWGSKHGWKVFALILSGMLLCACGLAVQTMFAAISGGTNRTATQVAEIFTGPVATEQPTIPPSPTPWPTFTPAPTFTPQPSPTNAPTGETQPQTKVKILSDQCTTAIDHLDRVSKTFTSDPTKALDEAWRADMEQALQEIKQACGTLDSASPVPGQVAEAQRFLTLTTNEYDQGNQLLKESIDQKNPEKVIQAGQHFFQAINYLGQAMSELKKIGQ